MSLQVLKSIIVLLWFLIGQVLFQAVSSVIKKRIDRDLSISYLKSGVVGEHFLAEPAVVDVVAVVHVQMDLDLRLLVERLAAGETHGLALLDSCHSEGECEVALGEVVAVWRVWKRHVARQVVDENALLVEADVAEAAGERRRRRR